MSGYKRVRANENDPVQMRRAIAMMDTYLGGSEAHLAMLMQSLLKHTNVIPPGGVNGEHLSADALTRIRSTLLAGLQAAASASSSVAWNSDQNILANQIFGS